MSELARCRAHVALFEAALRAGHPDVQGLCRALVDWSAEARLIEAEGAGAAKPPI